MLRKTKKSIAKLTAILLSAAIVFPVMHGLSITSTVRADDDYVTKTSTNTRFGVRTISDPRSPQTKDDPWQGSYVYLGTYFNKPMKYRVLTRNTTVFGSRSMLLEHDKIICEPDRTELLKDTDWFSSNLREYLNTEFLTTCFTPAEQASFLASNVTYTGSYNDFLGFFFVGPQDLRDDKIFLLNPADYLNPTFGYFNDTGWEKGGSEWDGSMIAHDVPNHTKGMILGQYEYTSGAASLLRTKSRINNIYPSETWGCVDERGFFNRMNDTMEDPYYFSPVMNIKYDSILFSTAVEGTYGAMDTEYKLTLLDPTMSLSVPDNDVHKTGNTVDFNYYLSSGTGMSVEDWQVTYLITKKPYGSDNNTILALNTMSQDAGHGEFTLPGNLAGSWGEDYFVYVFAESINKKYETDYASKPVELLIPQHYQSRDSFVGKTAVNTRFGVTGMHDPREPENVNQKWWGSYVYFGTYDGKPIRFRVLDVDSTRFGEESLFLDSDKIILSMPFDDAEKHPTNDWSDSSIRDYLNGDFLDESFSSAESEAILQSNLQGGENYPGNIPGVTDFFETTVGLEDDKVFLLDIEDFVNPQLHYGYINDYGWLGATQESRYWIENHRKEGEHVFYLLRSPSNYHLDPDPHVHGIDYDGAINFGPVDEDGGVAPALNVKYDSILFSTAVNTTKYGELGAEYKLTIKDPNIDLAINSVAFVGDEVKVNYDLSGTNAHNVTQLSYVITKTEDGVEDIAYYGSVKVNGSVSTHHIGEFSMPDALTGVCGTDYKMYFCAEDINLSYQTDYASELQKVDKSKMALAYDLSNGDIVLNATQRAAINELGSNGSINVRWYNQNSLYIDADKNGTPDFIMIRVGKNWCLRKLSNCSIRGTYTVAQSTYAGVMFRTYNGTALRPKVSGHQIRLSDEINVKYRLEIPAGVDTSNAYMKFDLSDGRTQTVSLQSAQVDPTNSNARIFAININALELDESITATLHFGSGEELVNIYSVENYIDTILNPENSYTEKDKALAGALRDYGYYMQQQTTWTDGSEHNTIAEPVNTLTQQDVVDAKTDLSAFGMTKDLGTSGLNSKVKVALTLNEKTILRILVKTDGNAVITSPNAVETVINGETYYQFSSPGIGPQDLGTDYEFVIETNTGTAKISVCPMYYVKQLMNSTNLTEEQSFALTSYYRYWIAAKNY